MVLVTAIVGGFVFLGLVCVALRLAGFLFRLGSRATHDVINYANGGKPTVINSRKHHSEPVTYTRPSGVRITFTDDA